MAKPLTFTVLGDTKAEQIMLDKFKIPHNRRTEYENYRMTGPRKTTFEIEPRSEMELCTVQGIFGR